MSTTDDTNEIETGVEQITKDTLVPIRVTRSGMRIGNKEESLSSSGSTWTKYLLYATAESVLRCDEVRDVDRGSLSMLMESGLEFESYEDEADNRFGRPVLQIVVNEGEDAYDALRGKFDNNAYLHAGIKQMTVAEAAEELGVVPVFALVDDEGELVDTIGGGYSDPDLLAGAMRHEGGVVENDLRDFTPSLDWVLDNWRDLGGRRGSIVTTSLRDDGTEEALLEMCRDDGGHTVPSILNSTDKGETLHGIKEVEEPIVDDEEDQYRPYCGSFIKSTSTATILDVEVDSVDDRLLCSVCASSMEEQ